MDEKTQIKWLTLRRAWREHTLKTFQSSRKSHHYELKVKNQGFHFPSFSWGTEFNSHFVTEWLASPRMETPVQQVDTRIIQFIVVAPEGVWRWEIESNNDRTWKKDQILTGKVLPNTIELVSLKTFRMSRWRGWASQNGAMKHRMRDRKVTHDWERDNITGLGDHWIICR